MDDKLVNDLVKAREVLKQKLRTLKADIASSQRAIDIKYAPISKPLQEIAMKLDGSDAKRGTSRLRNISESIEESWSDIYPEKSYAAVPGTSIIRYGTPKAARKQVSWFSPATHSSPTKKKQRWSLNPNLGCQHHSVNLLF